MAPINNNNTILSHNKVYNNYFPIFLISLVLFYTTSYVIVYSIRKYTKNREKRQSQEKKRLKQIWETSIKKHQLCDSLVISEKVDLPQLTYSRLSSSTFTSSVTVGDATLPSNSSMITFACDLKTTSTKDSSIFSFERYSKTLASKLAKQNSFYKGKNGLKINNSKRLRLLWQWGSAMGYVEYGHAKELDALIFKLSK